MCLESKSDLHHHQCRVHLTPLAIMATHSPFPLLVVFVHVCHPARQPITHTYSESMLATFTLRPRMQWMDIANGAVSFLQGKRKPARQSMTSQLIIRGIKIDLSLSKDMLLSPRIARVGKRVSDRGTVISNQGRKQLFFHHLLKKN